MNNKILVLAIIFFGIVLNIFPQQTFRRVAYLSQSVGTHIYDHSQVGPPGTTTVPNEVDIYNSTNGYTGENAFTIYNPTNDYPPGGNQMWKWKSAFYDEMNTALIPPQPYNFKEDYLDTDTYDIIMVKFCAASQSGIWFWWYEGPQDTLNYPLTQSTYNYQWYMRKIVRKMEEYPNKFFFLWNIPSATEQEGTPADMQRLADFNKWMTDTLQAGLDSYGAFPPNVKIFDFFNLLKSPNSNYMNPIYRDSFDDYHPNALASSVVAPILVQRMFDAAIAYDPNSVTFQLSVPIQNDWNLVSVPGLHPLNQNVNTWWMNRDPFANVFRYTGSYQSVTSVSPGIGYTMKHYGPQLYNTGDEWPASGIRVADHHPINGIIGWNLIGGYELSVATADITTVPPGLQSGPIYNYSSGYQVANTLHPGYGYWMKLTAPGQIIIPETLAKGTEPVNYFPDDWGKIMITDATGINYILYAVNGEVDLNRYELPPATMSGMVDIRYSSGRIAENLNATVKTIEMNGVTYPLIIRVANLDLKLQDPSGKEINIELKPGEKITIINNSINKLNVLSSKVVVAPIVYTLQQNYPNPFNPSTKISFALPEAGNVKLSIYNILGQEIRRLVDEYTNSGNYTINFDASELNSGMYVYKLEVNGFTQTRKMVLIK